METTDQDPEARLRNYLQTQFSDLEGAKLFMQRFYNEMEQDLPGFGMFSVRAMAAHVSAALEDKEVESIGAVSNYMQSKYGTDLAHAAWSA